MLIQEYLRNHTIEQLEQEHHVYATVHKDYPELVLFKYDMIEADFSNPLVCECRGLILNKDNDWQVVSRSYDKFFNYGEGKAAEIDWKTARVYEKVDGSLAVLYWYDGYWQVQTSGMPDASGEVQGWPFSFNELFWKTWKDLEYQLPDLKLQELCFAFELMTPYNRVVVPHKESRIVLHGYRNRITGEQGPLEDFAGYDWAYVKSYPLQSWSDILEVSKHLDPMVQEGYVVCDGKFNRVKVKTPQYVAIAHIRESNSPKKFLEVIRKCEESELLTYFPEWTDEVNNVKSKYKYLQVQLQSIYDQHKDIENQKEFALTIQKFTKFTAPLFSLRSGRVKSITEFLVNMNIDNLYEQLTSLVMS